MRIKEALKNHFSKNLLNYGIISGVLSIVIGIFTPDIVRWIFFNLADCNRLICVDYCVGFALIWTAIASPMIASIIWLFNLRGRDK